MYVTIVTCPVVIRALYVRDYCDMPLNLLSLSALQLWPLLSLSFQNYEVA